MPKDEFGGYEYSNFHFIYYFIFDHLKKALLKKLHKKHSSHFCFEAYQYQIFVLGYKNIIPISDTVIYFIIILCVAAADHFQKWVGHSF